MGSQSTRCCCRDDREAEKVSEGQGNVPSTIVHYDREVPLYQPLTHADPSDGAGLDGYQGYEQDNSDSFAAPPPDYNQYNPPLFREVDMSEDNIKDATKTNGHKDPYHEKPAPETKKSKPTPYEDTPFCLSDVPTTPIPETIEEESTDKVYGRPGMVLQIHLDTGWAEFAADDMKQINNHLKAGSDLFAITSRGAMYMIDFRDTSNITQTNPTTRKIRNLRLVSESAKHNTQDANPSANKLQNGHIDFAKDENSGEQAPKPTGGKCCVIS